MEHELILLIDPMRTEQFEFPKIIKIENITFRLDTLYPIKECEHAEANYIEVKE